MQRLALAIGLVAVLFTNTPVAAQTGSQDSQAIVEELARLNATLSELRELLVRQLRRRASI